MFDVEITVRVPSAVAMHELITAVNNHVASQNYSGHGATTGGLQQHSIGDTYPWTVVARQLDGITEYAAFNCCTNETLAFLPTYKEAATLIPRHA